MKKINSNMLGAVSFKKILTVSMIALVSLGAGYFLFKISPPSNVNNPNEFDFSNVQPTDKIRDLEPADHVLGNREAKNTLVAYEDIQCPACRSFEPVLKSLPAELKDTKVIFRHFPLISLHKNATAAAYASEAASAQGKFWEWVALAYEKQSEWSLSSNPQEQFVDMARAAGVLDLEKFKLEYESKTYKSRVETDMREAVAINVAGTPSLYFNGVKIELTGLEGIKKQAEKLYK